MNASVNNALATALHFDDDNLWVEFADGRRLAVPLAYLPLLRNATPAQQMKYVISGGGTGLHWEELDEDILVENLLLSIRVNNRKRRSVRKTIASQQSQN